MKKLSEYIKWYLYITAGILLVTAIAFTSYGVDSLPAATLWQIMGSGLLTTFVTVLMAFKETRSKTATIVKHVLHYLALCAVMVVCGNWFGWMNLDLGGIVFMAVTVAVVYVLAFSVYYIIDLKQAKDINEVLKEKYGDEE